MPMMCASGTPLSEYPRLPLQPSSAKKAPRKLRDASLQTLSRSIQDCLRLSEVLLATVTLEDGVLDNFGAFYPCGDLSNITVSHLYAVLFQATLLGPQVVVAC